jgi:hypothetical protein
MALKPLILQLFASIAVAYQVTLPSELGKVVPGCARGCVEFFVEDGFQQEACSEKPSLQCLCSTRSSSGWTLGEGAVACVIAGSQAGLCSNSIIQSMHMIQGRGPRILQLTQYAGNFLREVLDICEGRDNALPNTVSRISATISRPSLTGTDFIIIAPTSTDFSSSTTTTNAEPTTTTSKSRTSSFTTTSRTNTNTPTVTTTPTTTTDTYVPSSPPASTTEFAGPPPEATSSPAAAPTTLQTAQIAGISIGIAGAIVIALGAIFIARRIRRRNFPELDDDESGYGNGKGSKRGSRMTQIFHISPPVFRFSSQSDAVAPPPPVYSNSNHSAIGLAISRPRSGASTKTPSPQTQPQPQLQRKTSRLLPAKPNLTLTIPSSQPSSNDRSSIMTNVTAFADLDTEAAENGQIWRPPSSDPMSATAVYVADKRGNWVLSTANRSEELNKVAVPAELDTHTPLTKSPIEKQEEEAAAAMAAAISAASDMQRPKPEFLSRDPARRPRSVSRASSLYSQASMMRGLSRPYAQRKTSERDSVTPIDASTPVPGDDQDMTMERASRLSALSPVIESPLVGVGRKALANPRIPGRFGGATIRQVPPPKRPNFSGSPPGQTSPTLGSSLGSPSAYPAPLNPRRHAGPPGLMIEGSGFSPIPPTHQRLSQHPTLDVAMHGRPHVASQHIQSPVSAATASSAASSLLAKRLGSDKAAALALVDPNGNRRPANWTRQGGGGPSTPGLGIPIPDTAATLPVTPAWQPRLTPTRRGDDLFLNVQ